MANPHRAGIPDNANDGFDSDPPANLGHALEAPVLVPRSPVPPKAPSREQPVRSEPQEPPKQKERDPKPLKVVGASPPTKPKTVPYRKKRIEVGADIETKDKIRRIVASLRQQGPQEDASASEFLQAAAHLISQVHHSANYLKLRSRGKWGTDQAREFIETLSNSYFRALGELYVKENYQAIRAQVEEDIARESDDTLPG